MPSLWYLVPLFKSLPLLFILSFFIQYNNLKKQPSMFITKSYVHLAVVISITIREQISGLISCNFTNTVAGSKL